MKDEIIYDGEDPNQTASEVGYKRPPKEHQFKKGGKPPPRRKKTASEEIDPIELFWRVLQEPRRLTINGKRRWATTSELIVRRARIEAEKGSPTIARLLNGLLFEGSQDTAEDTLQIERGSPRDNPRFIGTVELTEGIEYADGVFRKIKDGSW